MSLSIFSFKKRETRASTSTSSWESEQSSVALLDAPEEEEGPRDMLLDLEHLTPEVLDAFFPSESTLPVEAL
jgi:hypothetical protein